MSDDSSARQAGLAHVATASFVASRVVPTGGFAVALAGGVALARVGQQAGARVGYGASLAAMLQAVAVMGPLRVGIPLTQALSAPLLGRMHARGAPLAAALAACVAIRLLDQLATTLFYIWIVAGGVDAYAATYDALTGNIPGIPQGASAALVATALVLTAWTLFASTVQVLVYRAALTAWPPPAAASAASMPPRGGVAGASSAPPEPGDAAASPAPPSGFGAAAASSSARAPTERADDGPGIRRYDPRAVAAAASVAFVALLVSTAWIVLGALACWLALAWVTARADREPLRAGVALGALLALGALIFGLVGGIGVELTLQRTVRVTLLVLVATWLRAAAGEAGLREVFRRALHRVRRLAPMAEAAVVLERLGATGALATSARALVATVRHVPRRPQLLAGAVLGWIAVQAARFVPPRGAHEAQLRLRARDVVLVVAVTAAAAAAGVASA